MMKRARTVINGLVIMLLLFPSLGQAESIALELEPNEQQLTTHHHYKNHYGAVVHSPSKSNTNKIPQGATAKCNDGSYSFSLHRRGTCSHHGGVLEWL